MIVVADSGSTKTSWCLIDAGGIISVEETEGFNPLALTEAESVQRLQHSAISRWPLDTIDNIYFYSAGLIGDAQQARLQKHLTALFTNAKVEAYSDLLGAARACFGGGSGIVGILGTGSNSGLYNGKQLIETIPPLGYILGDEGSGSALGKALIKAFLRTQLSDELSTSFKDYYPNYHLLVQEIYQEKHAARKLAGLVPFIAANKNHPEIQQLLNTEFARYFDLLQQYDLTQPVKLVGSVAHYFSEEIKLLATTKGIQIEEIVKSPIDKLTLYHQSKINEPD